MDIPRTAKGFATPIEPGSDEEERDLGIGQANPNLHRRIENPTETRPGEVAPRQYSVGVLDGVNSYQVEEIFCHDEESTTCEIP